MCRLSSGVTSAVSARGATVDNELVYRSGNIQNTDTRSSATHSATANSLRQPLITAGSCRVSMQNGS